MKKLLLGIVLIATMLIGAVSAIDIGNEFYLYGRDNKEVSKILEISQSEIENYCQQNGITLLAVNHDNTKQIRQITVQNDFSKKIGNLAVLSNDEILKLTYDLCRVENARGKVLEKNGFKYLKLELKSVDSGGDYILTQYITVTDKNMVTLSFYTDASLSTDYCDEIFNSQFENLSGLKTVLMVFLILLSGVALLLSVMIVRDLNQKKKF